MTDSVAVLPPGFRVLDSDGAPVSGAQIRFFEAGTTTPKEVFSDSDLTASLGSVVYTRSDGFPVAEEDSTSTVIVYIGTGLYKVDILDEDDATLFPAKDNVKGAVQTTDEGTPATQIPVDTQTGTISITAAHNSKLVRGNTSGADVNANLASAAVLGDGWNARFVKTAAANAFNITPTGGEFINGLATIALKDQYDFIEVHCDGSAFYVGAQSVRARQRDIGDVRIASVAGARTGELECDGTSYLRADYPDLFAKISTQHGAPDGTHFRVPFYSGLHLRVWDHGKSNDPDSASRSALFLGGNAGDNPGSYQADSLKSHTHPINGLTVQSGVGAIPAGNGTGGYNTGTPSTGADAETRGKNVYVAAYILAKTF